MNKKHIIERLGYITDDMREQLREWVVNNHEVNSLEVDAFLSNIRYLIEQAEILNNVLIDETNKIRIEPIVEEAPIVIVEESTPIMQEPTLDELQESFQVDSEEHISNEPLPTLDEEPIQTMEEVMIHTEELIHDEEIMEAIEQASFIESNETPLNERFKSEQESLLERLKKLEEEKSIGEHLKSATLRKDLNFSLNDRFFIINNLFDGNTSSFSEVLIQLADLNDWETVEIYLNEQVSPKYNWQEKVEAKEKFMLLLHARF